MPAPARAAVAAPAVRLNKPAPKAIRPAQPAAETGWEEF
jgi:hypothetical protein